MLYDERYHLHVGYYENGFDLEAIAFKRQSDEIWDIFFDFERYGLQKPVGETESTEFGICIFSVETEELDYKDGTKQFEEWLSSQRIIR